MHVRSLWYSEPRASHLTVRIDEAGQCIGVIIISGVIWRVVPQVAGGPGRLDGLFSPSAEVLDCQRLCRLGSQPVRGQASSHIINTYIRTPLSRFGYLIPVRATTGKD